MPHKDPRKRKEYKAQWVNANREHINAYRREYNLKKWIRENDGTQKSKE